MIIDRILRGAVKLLVYPAPRCINIPGELMMTSPAGRPQHVWRHDDGASWWSHQLTDHSIYALMYVKDYRKTMDLVTWIELTLEIFMPQPSNSVTFTSNFVLNPKTSFPKLRETINLTTVHIQPHFTFTRCCDDHMQVQKKISFH